MAPRWPLTLALDLSPAHGEPHRLPTTNSDLFRPKLFFWLPRVSHLFHWRLSRSTFQFAHTLNRHLFIVLSSSIADSGHPPLDLHVNCLYLYVGWDGLQAFYYQCRHNGVWYQYHTVKISNYMCSKILPVLSVRRSFRICVKHIGGKIQQSAGVL